MKVSIFYLYGQHNAGDAAIGLGFLAMAENVGIEVNAFSRWPDDFCEFESDKQYYQTRFPGLQVNGGHFAFRRSRTGLQAALSYIKTLMSFSSRGYASIKSDVTSSDLIVLNGGNLLRCQNVTDLIRLAGFILPLYVARKNNVPYVILPQSTSGINFFGRYLMAPLLESAKKVWARERLSLSKFKNSFPNLDISYAPDMAFHIPTTERFLSCSSEYKNKEPDTPRLAITLRGHTLGDIEPFEEEKTSKIVSEYKTLLTRFLSETNQLHITIVVQCDKDVEISNQLVDALDTEISNLKLELVDTRDTYQLIGVYANHDLLIGMRLHSIIMALSIGTPCIGYFDKTWGLKNPGVLEEFGLPVIFIDDNESSLYPHVKQLLRESLVRSTQIKSKLTAELSFFRDELHKILTGIDD